MNAFKISDDKFKDESNENCCPVCLDTLKEVLIKSLVNQKKINL